MIDIAKTEEHINNFTYRETVINSKLQFDSPISKILVIPTSQ